MSLKKNLAPILILATVFLLSIACQRKSESAPDPFGPGTSRLTMDLVAYPNVLLVTSAGRQTSQVTATVIMDGNPLSGALVIFTITDGLGEFSNYQSRIAINTNGAGVATATFVSPSLAEFSRDYYVTLEAQVQTNSPFYLWKTVQIRVMQPKE